MKKEKQKERPKVRTQSTVYPEGMEKVWYGVPFKRALLKSVFERL